MRNEDKLKAVTDAHQSLVAAIADYLESVDQQSMDLKHTKGIAKNLNGFVSELQGAVGRAELEDFLAKKQIKDN